MSVVFINLNNDSNGEKMSTCSFRSEREEVRNVPKCCGKHTAVMGYVCTKRGIHPLKNNNCDVCTDYCKKE